MVFIVFSFMSVRLLNANMVIPRMFSSYRSHFFMVEFTALWANLADDKLMIFFLFSQETGFDISCKFAICRKCQNLFYGKNKKIISKCCLLKFLPRVLSVKYIFTSLSGLLCNFGNILTLSKSFHKHRNKLRKKI